MDDKPDVSVLGHLLHNALMRGSGKSNMANALLDQLLISATTSNVPTPTFADLEMHISKMREIVPPKRSPLWDSFSIYGMDFAAPTAKPEPDPDQEFWDLVRDRKIKKLCKQYAGKCMEMQGQPNRNIQPNRGPVPAKDWK